MTDKDGMYTPPPDRPLSYDVRDEDGGGKGMVLLMVAAVLVVAFGVVVWSMFKSGVRDRDMPPYITASDTPFKVAPDDPGGLEAPDQDKTVYDTVSGEESPAVKSFAAGPEEPVALDKDAPKAAPSAPVKTAALKPAAPKKELAKSDPLKGAEPAPMKKAEKKAEPSAPVEKKAESPAEASKPKPKPEPKPATATTGGYVVQLAATRSAADADATWTRLQGKYPALKSHSKSIERADLGDKGIYYRVRAAGFADKAAAQALCADLKAAGQGCLVRK